VGTALQINARFHPRADVQTACAEHDAPMTTTDYLIDSALILLVLAQIKERPITTRQLLRPVIIVGIAVASYLNGIPTGGNDLVLAGALALLGGAIGVASGQTVIMRRGEAGEAAAVGVWRTGSGSSPRRWPEPTAGRPCVGRRRPSCCSLRRSALPRGAAPRRASGGVGADRPRDPRRARARAGRPDDPAGGDQLAARGRRRAIGSPGAPAASACAGATVEVLSGGKT